MLAVTSSPPQHPLTAQAQSVAVDGIGRLWRPYETTPLWLAVGALAGFLIGSFSNWTVAIVVGAAMIAGIVIFMFGFVIPYAVVDNWSRHVMAQACRASIAEGTDRRTPFVLEDSLMLGIGHTVGESFSSLHGDFVCGYYHSGGAILWDSSLFWLSAGVKIPRSRLPLRVWLTLRHTSPTATFYAR